MEKEKKKKLNTTKFTAEEKRVLIVVAVVILIIIIVITILILSRANNSNSNDEIVELSMSEEIDEKNEEEVLNNLYDMDEQARISYYCGVFFKLVQQKNYTDAYELLYGEYVENYFPTQRSFEVYMEDYFPDSFSLEYTNIERIGNIYVLWVSVNDTNGTKYGHNFSLNVVIEENDYNDFYLSFSRNSAVESM